MDNVRKHALIAAPAERLKKKYPEMAEPFGDKFDIWVDVLYSTQIFLRRAWEANSERSRQWYLHEMRRHYRDAVIFTGDDPPAPDSVPGGRFHLQYADPRLLHPPKVTPFEEAAFYFQSRIGQRARRCQNDNCGAPYFIAPPAKARKYCSPECSADADRENKRKWWHDKGWKRRTK